VWYDIGDTRGLTCVEWLCGPLRNTVILGSEFADAYNSFHVDDDGFLGVPPWQVPNPDDLRLDPAGDGSVIMNIEQYDAACTASYEYYTVNLLGVLNDDFIVTCNGSYLNPAWPTVLRDAMHTGANGCKLQGYAYWGGWPRQDAPAWFALWEGIEEAFLPFGGAMSEEEDLRQGIEVTYAQPRIKDSWSTGEREQFMRETLGHTLMYDGVFAPAWRDDEFGLGFLDGEGDPPPFIPHMAFPLGRAMSERQTYTDPDYPDYPLYYRYFQRESEERFTVVVNMWEVEIGGIPARDAVWFHGDWPDDHQGPVAID
jgi:hypothetical protein